MTVTRQQTTAPAGGRAPAGVVPTRAAYTIHARWHEDGRLSITVGKQCLTTRRYVFHRADDAPVQLSLGHDLVRTARGLLYIVETDLELSQL